jgi:hypothetical protein
MTRNILGADNCAAMIHYHVCKTGSNETSLNGRRPVLDDDRVAALIGYPCVSFSSIDTIRRDGPQ